LALSEHTGIQNSGGGKALSKDKNTNPGSIAGVWATKNTRSAMTAKEHPERIRFTPGSL